MPDRLVVNCSTGEETRIPLTPQEEEAQAEQATQASQDAAKRQTEEGNDRTLRTRAEDAMASNRTYIAITAPTGAQTTAQVKALSRQNNALIRLLLGLLDDVT